VPKSPGEPQLGRRPKKKGVNFVCRHPARDTFCGLAKNPELYQSARFADRGGVKRKMGRKGGERGIGVQRVFLVLGSWLGSPEIAFPARYRGELSNRFVSQDSILASFGHPAERPSLAAIRHGFPIQHTSRSSPRPRNAPVRTGPPHQRTAIAARAFRRSFVPTDGFLLPLPCWSKFQVAFRR
jgi:hypothetical protein